MPRILTKDVADGVTETFEYDDATHEVIVRRSQDVEPILDHVAAKASISDGKGNTFWHVAETPITVAIEWAQARGIPWEEFVYTNRHADEWNRMIMAQPKLSPTGGKR